MHNETIHISSSCVENGSNGISFSAVIEIAIQLPPHHVGCVSPNERFFSIVSLNGQRCSELSGAQDVSHSIRPVRSARKTRATRNFFD